MKRKKKNKQENKVLFKINKKKVERKRKQTQFPHSQSQVWLSFQELFEQVQLGIGEASKALKKINPTQKGTNGAYLLGNQMLAPQHFWYQNIVVSRKKFLPLAIRTLCVFQWLMNYPIKQQQDQWNRRN